MNYARLLIVLLLPMGAFAQPGFIGSSNYIRLAAPGCNAVSPVQIPGSADLFINRRLLTDRGQLAGVDGPNDCSGGRINRLGLVIDRLDWRTGKFSLVKALLNTSVDTTTGHSRAIITEGPMRGAIIQSAYDADVVVYKGAYIVVFECTLANGAAYGVQGTSIGLSVYDPVTQTLDMSRTVVIIGAIRGTGGLIDVAAVPELLVYRDRLYLYWSDITIRNGQFLRIAVRGAELAASDSGVSVRGAAPAVLQHAGGLVHTTDEPATTEVWAPDPNDPSANQTVDIRALWVHDKSVFAMSSQGGSGCLTPVDSAGGCFHMVIVKTREPLKRHGFNEAERIDTALLPTNPQVYTRPIKDSAGRFWMIGNYFYPRVSGGDRIAPGAYWNAANRKRLAFILSPLLDPLLPN
ncbi:hypothetical protein [Dinghuibacter silviterrae]|uniref:Uncharacterized protein n=1 Tax=Dinghuibacter silviterrae TaxID=1539049 RepID=A0A4R8DFH0_9BACT|nr:hypothetical protein [Dinghuibacter silviterrae]TDW96177.1 hypothetical protein EDB95_4001 [Dinghuibacter silviterrae]